MLGPDGLPIRPSLILGESGVAFVTDGTSTGDSTTPGEGPKIVAFDINSGAVNWSYQVTPDTTLGLIAASLGGGLAAKSTSNGLDTILRFDTSGGTASDGWSGPDISNFGGAFWLGYSSSNSSIFSSYSAPVELSTSTFYGVDGNGGDAAVQDVSVPDFSQSNPNQATIAGVLQKLLNALPNNSTCSNWLAGAGEHQGISGAVQIQNVMEGK